MDIHRLNHGHGNKQIRLILIKRGGEMEVTHLEAYKQRTYQQRIDEQGKPEIDAKYPEKKSKGRPALIAADKLRVDMDIEALEKVSNYD